MRRTPLYNFHIQHGAKMVDFAGWEMPVLYTSIVEEHQHTRRVASLFDVSHMGRLEVRGHDAESLLQRVCTRQLGDMTTGQSRYTHACNEQGGILDDMIVSRFEDHWLVVCNASNRDKILAWMNQQATGRDVRIADMTESTLMVALQGPTVIEKLSDKLPIPIKDLKRYHFITGSYLIVSYTVFRGGYTGEDGVEMIVPASVAPMLSSFLDTSSEPGTGPHPAGLGARDTLRLEAGMPLYGHELHEKIDPITAGQQWCVDLEKDFIGGDALRRIAAAGPDRKLVGLELQGRRIARQHATVLDGDAPIGEVTSGTFAPTLQKSIAMAYVSTDVAEVGRSFAVDLGAKRSEAVVVPLPFYMRKST